MPPKNAVYTTSFSAEQFLKIFRDIREDELIMDINASADFVIP